MKSAAVRSAPVPVAKRGASAPVAAIREENRLIREARPAKGISDAGFPGGNSEDAEAPRYLQARAKPGADAASEVLRGYRVVHAVPGRMRLRPAGKGRDPVETRTRLQALCPDAEIKISPVTGSILVLYARTGTEAIRADGDPPFAEGRIARNPIPGKARSFFYPRVLVYAFAVLRAVPYIFKGLTSLLRGRVTLDVLDGAALVVCVLQRNFRLLSSITFFFALGEYLADWTRKKSRASLAESLRLTIDRVWIRADGVECLVPFADLRKGDVVVVRAGAAIPVDGTVVAGEGMVNQSSMTGEPLAVAKASGSSVYAGTILEEGELEVEARQVGNEARIHAILATIEESERAKSVVQGRYEHIADAMVPYNFLLSGAVYAATRNLTRAGSVLLVDYSCAIRLAAPLCVFAAMQEAAAHGILIKGGKFMEAVAEADVLVFDKTGTLTCAKPELAGVVPFGKRTRESVLRLAACLEEHFAHPVGQAVVRASDAEKLRHREEHTQVQFTVAHGIASLWRGERVLIGSDHFVLEDEGVRLSPQQADIVAEESGKGRSILYLSVDGELAGLLLIEDRIREDAREVVGLLRADGVRRVIMLTGDGEQTAASIAAQAGIDEYKSQMLPEDKAAFVAKLKREGNKVVMVGDGINDAPALSAAHVGVAMSEGADMAREVADIVLMNGRLDGLLLARRISRGALRRIHANFHASLFWNSVFLAGGLLGAIGPGLSAFLHNATTAAIAASSIRPLLPPPAPQDGPAPENRQPQ
ncbi:MAG: heavy metal translocating P-type ATPase [Desulfovibrio sp.]|nr:heavy metal translocating P-type ATPase [Desulfovibrio sp.]